MFLFWPQASTETLPDEVFALDWGLLAAAMLVLFVSFQRRTHKEGVSVQDIGYRFSRTTLLLGLIVGAALSLAADQVALLDNLLSRGELERLAARLVQAIRGMPPLMGYALLPVNGLLVPVVEEYAWRGYIQARLTQGWGPQWGVMVAALLFTAKHLVVDLSFVRIFTLLVVALALGLTRHHWGTGASTVTHVVLNSYASWVVITQRA